MVCPALAELVVGRLVARHGGALVIVHGAAPGVYQSFVEATERAKVELHPSPEHPGLSYVPLAPAPPAT